MGLSSGVKLVRRLFRKAESQTAAVALKTGVRCRSQCGACCLSTGVETSPIEMLPIVRRLKREGELETVLEKIESHQKLEPCVLYTYPEGRSLEGQCSVYADRPLICRLFGFSARQSKTGELQMSFCRNHKEDHPEEVKKSEEAAKNSKLKAPRMTDYRMNLKALIPDDSLTELLPINKALQKAAELDYFDDLRDQNSGLGHARPQGAGKSPRKLEKTA